MIEFLPNTPGHLIAFRASGQIDGADVDRIAERFDQAFDEHEQVSFFAEAASMNGFAGGAFLKGMLYDLSQIKNLRRIHRAALVAEEGWIRTVAEWEDRLLPGLDVRIFDPDEHEEAMAWASEAPPVAGPPKRGLREIPTEDGTSTVAFAVTGPITGADIEAIAPRLSAAYAAHGSINLMMRLDAGYRFRLDVFSKELAELEIDALKHVDRYAIVDAPDWIESTAALARPLLKMDLRCFDADHEDAAWGWLGTMPAEA